METIEKTFYTAERLRELNPACTQRIDEATASRINEIVEKAEQGEAMQGGDIVLYTDDRGREFQARVEDPRNAWGKSAASICLEGSSVFIGKGFLTHEHVSISGGPWTSVEAKEYRIKERSAARFWQFAQSPSGGAGVYFTATVRVWELAA